MQKNSIAIIFRDSSDLKFLGTLQTSNSQVGLYVGVCDCVL